MGEEAHRGSPLAALAGLIVWPQVLSRFKRKKLGQTNGFECPGLLVSLLIITSVLRAQSGLGAWLDMGAHPGCSSEPPGGPLTQPHGRSPQSGALVSLDLLG